MRTKPFVIIPLFILLWGCSNHDITDKSKRNNKWVWWIDAKTGKGSWIIKDNEPPGVKNGKYTLFYFNGNIYEKGTMVNGDKVDTTFFFDMHGNLVAYKTYTDTRIPIHFLHDGGYTLYYDDGTLMEKGVALNHMPEGKAVGYFHNGKLSYEYNLVNGEGWNTVFNEDGKPYRVKYHRAGTSIDSDMVAREWYPSGALRIVNGLKKGEFEGIALKYYENGQLEDSGTWINGKRNGLEKSWYEDGKLHAINYRKDGKLNGRCSTYYRNGQLKNVAVVKDNILNGEVEQFDETGKKHVTAYYSNGVKIK